MAKQLELLPFCPVNRCRRLQICSEGKCVCVGDVDGGSSSGDGNSDGDGEECRHDMMAAAKKKEITGAWRPLNQGKAKQSDVKLMAFERAS